MTSVKTEQPIQTSGVEIPGTRITLDSIFSGVLDAGASYHIDLRVLLISQGGAPRWVLPQNTRRAVRVVKSWKPYRSKSRFEWNTIVGVCRLNLLGVLPGARRSTLRYSPSYWSSRLPGFSESWKIVAYIGNPFPTRKALLFFVDEDAAVKAVVKVPINPAARAAILNEANILTKLREQLPLPRVLFVDEHEGIAAQSWVEGLNLPRAFTAEHLDLLTRFASENESVRLSECRDALEERIAHLHPAVDLRLLQQATSLLRIQDEIKPCVEHGDFTPWNLRRLNDGRLTLIDWEWAVEAGYPWQDVCRYFYLQDYLFHEKADVWKILMENPLLAEYRMRFGLSPGAVRGLTARYLLRYLCDEHEEGNRNRVQYAVQKLHELLP